MTSTSSLYSAQHAVAVSWATAAERHLRSGQWLPTTTESRIAADLAAVTRVPSLNVPPHTDEPVWWRLQRLTHWPAGIRLGMLAGQWPLDLGGEPAPDTVADLPGLLTGLYGLLALTEQWRDVHSEAVSIGRHDTEPAADMRLAQRVPDVMAHIATTETLVHGVGSMLFAIATGDVS